MSAARHVTDLVRRATAYELKLTPPEDAPHTRTTSHVHSVFSPVRAQGEGVAGERSTLDWHRSSLPATLGDEAVGVRKVHQLELIARWLRSMLQRRHRQSTISSRCAASPVEAARTPAGGKLCEHVVWNRRVDGCWAAGQGRRGGGAGRSRSGRGVSGVGMLGGYDSYASNERRKSPCDPRQLH